MASFISSDKEDTMSQNGDQTQSKCVEFKYCEEKCSINDFENSTNLPSIVKFEDTDGTLDPGLKIYANQPVLFFSRKRKIQVYARSIVTDKSGSFLEVGQTLNIPVDYQGWFEVVPSDFSRASCYKDIKSLCENVPKRFFTRSNIKAIRVTKTDSGEDKYLERKIPAGSVLKTGSIFTAKWRTEAETGLFKKKNTTWTTYEVKYLSCTTSSDYQEVLIPLTTKGKFNAIYEHGKLDCNSVYRIKDIISDLTLPIRVRLLFGKAPVVPCIFTGMLNLRSAQNFETITCGTILNKRNVLFEIPTDMECTVQKLRNIDECQKLSSYEDGFKLCSKYGDMYSTMIKLSSKMDTDCKIMQHIPTDPSYMRKVDDALKALDLITDISLTDEPQDHLLESDSDSLQSTEVTHGELVELHKDISQSTA